MKKILLLILTLSFLGLFSQTYDTDIIEKNLEQKGTLNEYLNWKENAIRDFQTNKSQYLNKSMNAIMTVPVVVHVLYDVAGGAQDVPDAQIFDMIETINTDFARTNSDVGVTRLTFAGVASGTEIQFCLAQTAPDGTATTGITRNLTAHGWFNGAGSEDMKTSATQGVDPWDQTKYLNVWVCDITNGAGSGVAGWAYFPSSHGNPEDGIVLDYDIGIGAGVGPAGPNRTLTHELGHYFGLDHIWADGGCAVDDGFADTPDGDTDNMSVLCGATPAPDGCTADALPDQYENYMSYAICQNMFSGEQAAFMNNTLNTTRSSLFANNFCNPPTLTADFTPNTPLITIDAGQNVTFTDASSGPTGVTSWDWTFTGGSPSVQASQGPHTITYNTPGLYTVSITVGDGTNTATKTVTALVEVLLVLNANFSADITYAAIGENITFTDETISPEDVANWAWVWDFGDAATDNVQNPVHAYSATGLYTVELTVNDGVNSDLESKIEYIEVYDPLALNIDSFIGIPTVINVGEDVEFEVFCNQSDSDIDSVRWFFEGADIPTVMYTNTNDFDITYSTGGIFDVECRVYRNNATDGDTLIKQDYIIVIAPDSVPVANFVASQSNIPVNTTIDFINLTNIVDRLDSCRWFIQRNSATTEQSTAINPTGYLYDEVGDFDIQLFVYSPFGNHDTLKVGHVHVYDPADLHPITVDFKATTVRLITQGESVHFEDLSQGDIQDWTYIFDRGAGDASLEYEYTQNPEHTFLTAGIYNVTLIARNSIFADTLTKERYIVVTTTPWPEHEGYCDTLNNIEPSEIILTYREADYPSWGYFPGHYGKIQDGSTTVKRLKRYAEKFETYTPDNIAAVLVPVAKSYAGDDDAYIRVQIWSANSAGRPYQLLTGNTDNKVKINTLQSGMFNYIQLDEPVDVDSVFFIGFRLDYETTTSPQDTFAVHMAPNRPNPEENTIFVSTGTTESSDWYTPTEFLEFNLNSSMGIKVMGCVVNVPEIEELEATINVYPNPASDKLNIDLGDSFFSNVNIEMYDIVGKKINSETIESSKNQYQLDLNNCRNGFYLVNITVNGYQITKKVLIQK